MRLLLDAHPEIACRGEGSFFGLGAPARAGARASLHGALASGADLGDALADRGWWTRGRPLAELAAEAGGAGEAPAELAAAAIRRLLADGAHRAGKPLAGDKSTLARLDTVADIRDLLPDARVIHVIRDGRDVAVSRVHHEWKRAAAEGGTFELSRDELARRDGYLADPARYRASGESVFSRRWLEREARTWAGLVGAAREQGRESGAERYAEVRYEALRGDPQRELRRLLDFLGAATTADVVAACVEAADFERLTGRPPGDEDPAAFRRKGIVGDWRNVFTDADRALYERHAGELLAELGYLAE